MFSETINIVIPKIDLAIYNTRYLNNFQGIFFQGNSKKKIKLKCLSYHILKIKMSDIQEREKPERASSLLPLFNMYESINV